MARATAERINLVQPVQRRQVAEEMNRWIPISEQMPEDGVVIDLRFRDPLGFYESEGCALIDGKFYNIAPPVEIVKAPTHWRLSESRTA